MKSKKPRFTYCPDCQTGYSDARDVCHLCYKNTIMEEKENE